MLLYDECMDGVGSIVYSEVWILIPALNQWQAALFVVVREELK